MKKTNLLRTHWSVTVVGMFFIYALTTGFLTQRVSAAQSPGCYKIISGQIQKQNPCPTTNVSYDDGNGGNTIKADPKKCYIYSANLYDGDVSWGEPYVAVDCAKLTPCPSGEELRYSDSKVGAPVCTKTTTPTSGSFAGGAQPAQSSDLSEYKVSAVDFGGEAIYICGSDGIQNNATPTTKNDNEVHVAFNFGCLGDDYPKPLNPIVDIAFAIFRFLSVGVGLVVIGSIIVAGIQYSASRGDPQATQAAKGRITNAIIALVLYMFIFAIANYLVPGGMFIR